MLQNYADLVFCIKYIELNNYVSHIEYIYVAATFSSKIKEPVHLQLFLSETNVLEIDNKSTFNSRVRS